MAKVVNLNRARKAKTRAQKKAQAQANTIAFGRTKAETSAIQAENARQTRTLDGKSMRKPPKD
ncbi:MAG: DUF4169 family protein [Pseudomonadota bacterium]